jgi:large subunit ribosomal protein L9
MVQVILLERVGRLGHMGDTVEVKPGYARNFLLPRKKALRATASNRAFFDGQKAKLEADNAARKAEAEKLAKKMDKVKVVILRQAGENGHLYGSVSAKDISDAVTAAGYTIARAQVVMDHPIKTIGLFDEKVLLHPEVAINVRVNIARSVDEARIQDEKGVAVLTSAAALAEEEAAKAAVAAAQGAELAMVAAAAEADAAKAEDDAPKAAKKAKKSKKTEAEEADEE